MQSLLIIIMQSSLVVLLQLNIIAYIPSAVGFSFKHYSNNCYHSQRQQSGLLWRYDTSSCTSRRCFTFDNCNNINNNIYTNKNNNICCYYGHSKRNHNCFYALPKKGNFYALSSTKTSKVTSTCLGMALIPLNVNEIEQLISVGGKPTPQQYQSYFGRTSVERYNRILEGCIVALVGSTMSYFISFVLGTFVATVLGTLSILWGILSPELKAYQRNWEFLGGRKLVDMNMEEDSYSGRKLDSDGGLFGSLWMGYVNDVCVVEDATSTKEYELSEFDDYTMENDELDQYTGQPYLLRLQLKEHTIAADNDGYDDDEDCRQLQIHARMSEEYLNIRPGMAAAVLLLSTEMEFVTLAALTDVYVVDTASSEEGDAVLVGDYPYLNRAGLEELFIQDPDLWDILTSQQKPDLLLQGSKPSKVDASFNDNNYDYNEYDDTDDIVEFSRKNNNKNYNIRRTGKRTAV